MATRALPVVCLLVERQKRKQVSLIDGDLWRHYLFTWWPDSAITQLKKKGMTCVAVFGQYRNQ